MGVRAFLFSMLVLGTGTLLVAQIPSPNPDLNRDGIVDVADLNIVKLSYGKRCGQAGFNPIADVNKDCIVNLTDQNIVARAAASHLAVNDVLQVAASSSPAPNAQGWNNTNVTVSFVCTGTIPGDTCPAAIGVTTEGASQTITGTGIDTFGNQRTASASVNLDKTSPALTIGSPADSSIVTGSRVHVTGTASDTLSGLASVTCNGAAAVASGAGYACDVALGAPGPFSLTVAATDVAGNTTSLTRNLTIGTTTPPTQAPTVTITSPAPLSLFNHSPVDVSGQVDDPNATILVNGVAASVSGNSYSATGVPLREGTTLLTATATNTAGGVGTATESVVMDSTPPTVRILAPSDGAILTASQVTVTGNINDIVNGTVNAEQATVTVNGLPADVSNRTFVLADLLLVRGDNTIVARARDRAGNESETQVHVTMQDIAGQQRIVLVSGNNQQGEIGSTLHDPLVAQLVDATGRPLAGRPMTFTVRRSDGVLSTFDSQGQQVTVTSDANGQASVTFQIGSRTGVGNNEVAVSAAGFVGEVIFCASSTTSAANAINVAMGDQQRGVVGQTLGMPFIAIVTDRGGNPVRSVPVTFTIAQGGGNFGGLTSFTTNTDGDGKAAAFLILGQQEGINNNVVNAAFDGLVGAPATFTASGAVAGAAADTHVSGVVLDNANKPIPHAQAKIVDTTLSAFTDDQGNFSIPGAPVGTITLIVDGSTSTRPEAFPFLAFQLSTIAGQDNTLGMPIFLPPLDADNSKIVGGDQDVVLTMKDVPGYSFTIFAHSVTFADGSHVGRLSLSQVHADKVPMAPPNGTAPRIAGTLQPAGVHFNPPIRTQFPNVEGLAPGTVVDVVSFDHDIEDWVSVGPARVSPDGSVITSDPGYGIMKSGWHFPPPPPPPKKCVGSCDDKNPCTTDKCEDGVCKHDPVADGTACDGGEDKSFTAHGVTINIDKSCGMGSCKAGACAPKSDRWGMDNVENAFKDALDKIFGDCLGAETKKKMQDHLKDKGYKAKCLDTQNTTGTDGDDCASSALGGNALDVSVATAAACGSLAKTMRHEMQHGAGDDHVNLADGSLDCENDPVYGCDTACFAQSNCAGSKAASCK
jgi:glucodextranase-like protein/carboxypeptidase family protein